MARSYPPDIIVIDSDGLLHARIQAGNKGSEISQARTWRLPEGTFTAGVVTPDLSAPSVLSETLRRIRAESGKWEKVSILLPDSWFRINLVELQALPDRAEDAMHAVRWSLKRTMPIPPESLRVAYEVLTRSATGAKLLVLSAVEKTLAAIEAVFGAAGIEVILIEPVGLNIWNAVTIREGAATGDRLFVYVREHDFTTAVFRGAQPLFIRSRNLSGERTLQQEIRLSASYLRDAMQAVSVERCYLAGNRVGREVGEALEAEFGAPVSAVSLRDFVDRFPPESAGIEAELTACTGVFTG